MLALGRFRESVTGDITPRQVLILVGWESKAGFGSYHQDPRWPACTRTGNTAPRRTCDTCPAGSTACTRCSGRDLPGADLGELA